MNPLTILLAEDSYADQKLFCMALEDSDVHLEVVGDGLEALHFLGREGNYAGATQPYLVILDLNLPKISGIEVLADMKRNSRLKDVPVVIFSGAKPTKAALSMCKCADIYIVKPDDGDKYFAVVNALNEYGRKVLRFPNLKERYSEELHHVLKGSQSCDIYLPVTLERACG